MYSSVLHFLAILFVNFGSILSLEMVPQKLPGRWYPSKEYVTVSGSDSGGQMAQMMHISHSKYIKGCAVYSSTFYRCGPANGNVAEYRALCTKESAIPPDQQYQVDSAVTDIQSYSTNHLIDPLGNLRNSHLYVYCSLLDAEYSADQQLKVVALYENYLESPLLIRTRAQDTTTKMRVIDTDGEREERCPRAPEPDGTVSPNCTDMSAPAQGLRFLLSEYIYYVNPFTPYRRNMYLQPLWTFNQTEFTTNLPEAGLDDVGYYYIPKYCQSRAYSYGYNNRGKPCLFHVFFHGCGQGREFKKSSYIKKSNYLEIAESNNIIVLFPQAISSALNPHGCWDYIGWSGSLYATKKGQQIEAIWRMIERVLYLTPEPMPYSSTTGRSGGSDNSYKTPDSNYKAPETNYNAPGPQRGAPYSNNYQTCPTPYCARQPFYRRY